MSRLFISIARTAATQASSTPIAIEPAPSHRPSPVASVSDTPISANTRPVSAAVSSSTTAGSSGALARLMNRTKLRQLAEPRAGRDSLIAVRSENASSAMAMNSTTNATKGEVTCSGCLIRSTPSYTENSAPTVNSTTATMNA